MKGKFIVFEGPDGSGKTSNAQHATRYLNQHQIPAVYQRMPGSTPLGDKIREVIKSDIGLTDETMLLLFTACLNDAQHHIRRLLDSGINVLCDRWFPSSYVYQGYAGDCGTGQVFKMGVEFVQLEPDCTFYYMAEHSILERRINDRYEQRDRFEARGSNFLKQVLLGYNLAIDDPYGKKHVIDASKDIEQVLAQTENLLNKIFGLTDE